MKSYIRIMICVIIVLVIYKFFLRQEMGIFRLPGDISYSTENVQISFPIVSCLLLSFFMNAFGQAFNRPWVHIAWIQNMKLINRINNFLVTDWLTDWLTPLSLSLSLSLSLFLIYLFVWLPSCVLNELLAGASWFYEFILCSSVMMIDTSNSKYTLLSDWCK
jgi:hypothetical protein